MKTFRDYANKLPRWLQRYWGSRFIYALWIQTDAFIDALVAGVKMRFPGYYSFESLPLIGRERRIQRGLSESDATYAARLPGWLDAHATRGGPYALLQQLFAFYAPNNFPVRLIYRSGRYFDLATDGTITMGDQPSFSPDNMPSKWARWWLIFQWPTPVPAKRKWGAFKWGDGSTYGSGFTSADVYDLKLVPREWNAAHAQGALVIVNGGWVYGFPPRKWGESGLKWGGGASVKGGI